MIPTPKEKAIQLIERFTRIAAEFSSDTQINFMIAKRCAYGCVEEIIEAFPCPEEHGIPIGLYNYWLDVKTEIEKL